MRRPILLIFANVMILFVVFALIVHSAVIVQQLAVVDHLRGTVEVRRTGAKTWIPLRQNAIVRTYDVVRTGAQSSAELYWLDGTRMRLAPDTQMVIRKYAHHQIKKVDTSLFRLEAGKIWVRVMKALHGSSKFEIETPVAVATVRGTIFSVAVRGGMTEVTVYEGTVHVRTASTETDLARGLKADVSEVTTRPAKMQPADFAQWQRQARLIAPALEVFEPADGAQTDQPQILVRGFVEVKAGLTLNGKPVPTLQGKFRWMVRLKEGENRLAFVATDRKGVSTTVERRVVYAPPP